MGDDSTHSAESQLYLPALATLICISGVLAYKWFTGRYGDFARHGIPCETVWPIFGSRIMFDALTGRSHFLSSLDSAYDRHRKDKYFAYLSLRTPVLVINDLELAKLILIKNFDHFTDRRCMDVNHEGPDKFLKQVLTNMKGDDWRQMRNKVSPVFTSKKLRQMAPAIQRVADRMVKHMASQGKANTEMDCKDVMRSFALDVIAACGFGLDVNTFEAEDSTFKKMAVNFMGQSLTKFLFVILAPAWFCKMVGISICDAKAVDWFTKSLQNTIAARQKSGERRGDFVDILYEAFEAQKGDVANPIINDPARVQDLIISNTLLLFLAGFDTTSTALASVLYFMAREKESTEMLRSEIMQAIADKAAKKSGADEDAGDEDVDHHLDYDVVQNLPYLDAFIHECLRQFSIVNLERVCTKPFTLPGTGYTIREGDLVQMVSTSLMKDEIHFGSSPATFDPDQFTAEKRQMRDPLTFQSFGHGPRNCVGMRFALLEMKLAVATIVAKLNILPGSRFPDKLTVDPKSLNALPKEGLRVLAEERRSVAMNVER